MPDSTDLPLADWAERENVPYTTALKMVKTGKIPHTRKSEVRTFTVRRRVRGFYVPDTVQYGDCVKL